MSKNAQTVSYAQVISTFGTSFWLRSDSAADYILHPVFMRFMMLCIGIYALLDQTDNAQLLVGWQLPVLWLAMAISVIVGYVVLGGLSLRLFRHGLLRRIYTPFLLLPIVLIAEMTEQSIVVLLQAGDWQSVPQMLTDATRDMLVIMLMDAMHVQFVVPNHPLALTQPVAKPVPLAPTAWEPPPPVPPLGQDPAPRPEGETAVPPPPASDRPPEPMAERGMVRIADRIFALAEIQSVRTEDHYLNVVTRTSRNMVRAKLSDIHALHDGRHGVQINRSQWVAFSAIDGVKDEENGQVTLQLVNGDTATVSRTRRLMFMQLYNTRRGRPN